jgi:hypothetical protein
MKSKLLTLTLCLSLAFSPARVGADDGENGNMVAACVVAVICVGVGTVIVIGVHKMCKALDNMSKPPPDLPPYYITNGVLCTNFTIVHPRLAVLRMPSATAGNTVTLQASSGQGWQSAYHFDLSDNGGSLSVVVRDGAGVPVTTNSFAVTNDGTNRWSLCAFPSLPLEPRDNQMFRLQTTQ